MNNVHLIGPYAGRREMIGQAFTAWCPSESWRPTAELILAVIANYPASAVRTSAALSVVGTDRLQDSGYFRAKLAQERLIRASGIPFTLLHATQFFEFLRGIAGFSQTDEDGTVHLPPRRFQPMAAQDVAAAVAAAALAPSANSMVEVAGPEIFRIDELVARVLGYDKDTRRVKTSFARTASGAIGALCAGVVKLVDAPDSKTGCVYVRGGRKFGFKRTG
jgi:uncharacterized protein YbjT (DUF2867 family)